MGRLFCPTLAELHDVLIAFYSFNQCIFEVNTKYTNQAVDHCLLQQLQTTSSHSDFPILVQNNLSARKIIFDYSYDLMFFARTVI